MKAILQPESGSVTFDKPSTHHEKLDVLIENAREALHKMLDSAITSGSISADRIDADDYVLAKMVFTIWGDKREYAPPDKSNIRKMNNLAYFI